MYIVRDIVFFSRLAKVTSHHMVGVGVGKKNQQTKYPQGFSHQGNLAQNMVSLNLACVLRGKDKTGGAIAFMTKFT